MDEQWPPERRSALLLIVSAGRLPNTSRTAA
jgi:hypothetical protein